MCNKVQVSVFSMGAIHRLYEQKQTAPEGDDALDDYLTRWNRWVYAGLENLIQLRLPSAAVSKTCKSHTQKA